MSKVNYFLITFFSLCFLITTIYLYQHTTDLYRWQYGEWVINYQTGFVRRGLPGEVIYFISYFFNNNLQISFFIVLLSILYIFYFLNYSYLKDLKFNLIFILLLFSPLFFLFVIFDEKIGIRKEVLFYIYFLSMLIDFKNYGYRYKKMWLYVFLFPILLLCHEAIFFLLPYIISALIIFINKTNRKKIISQIFVLLFISLITELIIYNFKGDLHTAIFICESLGNFRPDNCVTNGAIAALAEDSSSFGIWLTYHDLKGYLTFLFVFFYGFFPFILFSLFANYKPNNKYSFNSKNITHFLFLFPFIFTLILFYMANDWGRWLSLNYFLMFYLLSHLIYHKFIVVKEDNILGIKIYNLKKINKILCIFVIFIYSSFFRMPNYYLPEREGLKVQYVDIYKNLSTWIKKHY